MKKCLKIIFTFVLLFTLFGVTKVNASAPLSTYETISTNSAKKGETFTLNSYIYSGSTFYYDYSVIPNDLIDIIEIESFNSNIGIQIDDKGMIKEESKNFAYDSITQSYNLDKLKKDTLLYSVTFRVKDNAQMGEYVIGKEKTKDDKLENLKLSIINSNIEILPTKEANIPNQNSNTEILPTKEANMQNQDSRNNNTEINLTTNLTIALSSIILVLLITILYLIIKIRKIKNSNLNNN